LGAFGIFTPNFGFYNNKMSCSSLVLGAPHIAVVAPVPPFHPGYALGAEALFTVQLGVECATSLRGSGYLVAGYM